ncbi:uncharacterized protein MYCGRDRAFT_106700 [Zymoseptoria tritici IPO323]|uniref:Uncharacterized protein n=1 Tax=Zymoseptoria tritici (strain CBS 115943 / IPO323) TaxID=336722 RepID=F9XS34_ZYMTI|nr:uncharacterized protein MYCGRDRAFT_106700 [Zymoseptoria tritici IPO323]EGP81948.1 hypothetical protein MYCGRDRAFT_106700 [Zymoseptoria tritici IPO323]
MKRYRCRYSPSLPSVVVASRHKSKRRAVRVTPRTFTHICQTEHMIREVNNFNALHLQLDKEEVPSIHQTILDAARAQRLQGDGEKLRLMTPKSTSGVLRARWTRTGSKSRVAVGVQNISGRSSREMGHRRYATTRRRDV